MKLIQCNIHVLKFLGPYEMLCFFLTLCFIVTKFCVLARLIILMHTIFLNVFLHLKCLMKCPPTPLRNVVSLNFTGYQMKAKNIDLIYILINEY